MNIQLLLPEMNNASNIFESHQIKIYLKLKKLPNEKNFNHIFALRNNYYCIHIRCITRLLKK